jgi:hypothetical protein
MNQICSGLMYVLDQDTTKACIERRNCEHYKDQFMRRIIGVEYMFVHWEGEWEARCPDYKEVRK